MTTTVSRPTVLKAGMSACAATGLALAAPPRPAAAQTSGAFRHGVASGDRLGTAVVIWTRVTPSDRRARQRRRPDRRGPLEVAADEASTTVLQSGTVRTDVPPPLTRSRRLPLASGGLGPLVERQNAGEVAHGRV